MGVHCEGVKGGDRNPPLSPPQRRNPLLAEKTCYVYKTSSVVAPMGKW